MLYDVCVISFKIVVFPGKNISELLHEGEILGILGRRQMSGQIYIFQMGWAPYIMFTDNRLILCFGQLIWYIVLVEQLL